MRDIESLKSKGWRELTGFERHKLNTTQACPTCPEMIEKSGKTFHDGKIEYDWSCESCDTIVVKIFREEATLCSKWEPKDPEVDPLEDHSDEEPTKPESVLDLQGFQKQKFLRSRACPTCPGMLEYSTEDHESGAVEYTWKCKKCGTSVIQRYEESGITWTPQSER